MTNLNLTLWHQVEKTNPNNTKKVEFGRKFTAIDAHSQIMAATATFGPCGIGWGVSDSKYEIVVVDPNDPHWSLIRYTGTLWYNWQDQTGSLDISADIELFENTQKRGWVRVEDTHKKVKTDALTKGLSWLGFNADVFMGKFDDNKYVREVAQEFSQPQPQKPAQEKAEVQDPELKAALDRLGSLAQKVGMGGAEMNAYLKKHYFTVWAKLDAKTAHLVADGIERSLAEV